MVCTPGRMIDILCTNSGRICNLKRVTFLVLDEADRMFDMGFEPQVMRIIEGIRPDRQTVMFSATFPRPVENAARKILTKPLEIVVGKRSTVCSDVSQHVEVRSEESKFLRLLDLLALWQDKGSILIFVDTQSSVDDLFAELLKKKFLCMSLHGGHDQVDRDHTISEFKKTPNAILVATSVVARGLDVPDLNLVINYDCPNHLEDYVHRVGRTGRAGKKGWAYTFITPEEDKYAPDLVKAAEQSGTPVPEQLKKLSEDYLAKQKAGTAASHGSGFGGKGFKFDEKEQAKKKLDRKRQKKSLGLDGIEEFESSESESEEEAAADAASAKSGTATAAPSGADTSVVQLVQQIGAIAPDLVRGLPPTAYSSIPELVKALPPNSLLSILPLLNQQQQAQHIASGGVPTTQNQIDAAKKAALLATLALNMKKNLLQPPGVAGQTPATQHFEAELEINDYPQQARWKVTHKDALYQITEMSGAAITTRGTFVAPGKNPPPGERKLYLYIEGPTDQSVKEAKAEIKKILEEATLTALTRGPDRPMPGKYRVF